MKHILKGNKARSKMLKGINELADMVKSTLGPQGRNAVIQSDLGDILITNDGVTIAKAFELPDAFENMGAMIVKEVATKTDSKAGDGTTTATTIAQTLANGCFELIEEGTNPVFVRKELNLIAKEVIIELEKMAKPVSSNHDIYRVGTISSADDSIGKLIAEAMDKVGNEGIVTVEEGRGVEDTLTVVNGMEFERGYLSQYMVTNEQSSTVEYHNGANILLSSRKISDINELINALDYSMSDNKPLLVIANEFSPEVISMLALNNSRGVVKVCAIQTPGFGDNQIEILKDIEAFTGATICDDTNSHQGVPFEIACLGAAGHITVSKTSTIIVDGLGEEVNTRKAQINNEINEAKTEFEIEKLKDRLANISGGVAIISAGATTETELKERKLRIEDALNATKAAAEEGILPGGGYALFKIVQDRINYFNKENIEASNVENVFRSALLSPINQIIVNTGGDPVEIIDDMLRQNKGYDALNEQIIDMNEAGIIDPLKVTKNALLNAISVVSTLITVEGAICPKGEEQKC